MEVVEEVGEIPIVVSGQKQKDKEDQDEEAEEDGGE